MTRPGRHLVAVAQWVACRKNEDVLVDKDAFTHSLSAFASGLVEGFGIADALHDVSTDTAGVLRATGAAVSLVAGGRLTFAASSDELAAALERVQEFNQHGPSVHAARSGEAVTVCDVREAGQRWPIFVTAALEFDIRAVAAAPIVVDGACVGAVTGYDVGPRAWVPDDLDALRVFAAVAGGHLLSTHGTGRREWLADRVRTALDSRVVIERAKGVVAGEHGVPVDEAFKLLREHARIRGADVHTVASAVVELGLRV